jgi:hypothetical protein
MKRIKTKESLATSVQAGVARALAARQAAGVELSAAEVDQVSGAGVYLKDPNWYGIWDWNKLVVMPDPGFLVNRLDAVALNPQPLPPKQY